MDFKSSDLAAQIIESSDDAIISKDLEGVVTSWNKGAEKIFGYTAKEMVGQKLHRLFRGGDASEEDAILKKLANGGSYDHFQAVRVHKDGHEIHISASISPIKDESGKVVGISKVARDITCEWELGNRLKIFNEVYRQSQQAVVLVNSQGVISEVNPAFEAIMGYSRKEVIGQNPLIFHSSKQGPEVLLNIENKIRVSGGFEGEVWARKKNGSTLASFLSISTINLSNDKCYAGIFSDITSLKAAEEQLLRMEHYDPITGLPNHLLFVDRLNQQILACERGDESLAVFYIDLDNFSEINERYGIDVGDTVIIEFSKKLAASMREVDAIARIGSDEFVGFIVGVKDDQVFKEVIDRIIFNLSTPYMVSGVNIQVGASVGVSFYSKGRPQHSDGLIRQADQAMLLAKRSGKGRYKVFDVAREQELVHRLSLLDEVRIGMEQDEFEMMYQPKVQLNTGELIGVEALVRWRHPTKGVLSPIEFLPSMVEASDKNAFSEYIIKKVFAWVSMWGEQQLSVKKVSINIYINQLDDAFVEFVKDQLGKHPALNPKNIEFELLESDLLLDVMGAIHQLEQLRALGFSFSIDDFGSGYSSLTYLRQIPFDTIKIDQGFVLNDGLSGANIDIVRAIIGLANIFKRHIIAEGVESVKAGVQLIENGCLYGQGYAIAKPMWADELDGWIEHWKVPDAWTKAVLH